MHLSAAYRDNETVLFSIEHRDSRDTSSAHKPDLREGSLFTCRIAKMKRPNPLVYAFCLVLLYELEENVVTPPIVRMLEDAICQQHFSPRQFDESTIPEISCKIEPIQRKLAYIRGYLGLFKNIPGMFTY
jgi:hypothetical protein